MDQTALDPKLTLIRDHFEKHLPHCMVVHEGTAGPMIQLSVTYGLSNRCSVQVSLALLSDPLVDSMELRWALKEKHIAAHVRRHEIVTLDHETLKIGDLRAIGRRPRR